MEIAPNFGRLTLEEANISIDFCDSYSRLPAILDLFGNMESDDWFRLLGQHWTTCDNIGTFRLNLRDCINEYYGGPDGLKGPVLPLMDYNAAELDAYDALPEVVTCYRGCGPKNMLGASWSLDRDLAAKFPYYSRYWTNEPMLVTARVRRERILAVKLNRGEQEIITFSARRITVERLPERPMFEPAAPNIGADIAPPLLLDAEATSAGFDLN